MAVASSASSWALTGITSASARHLLPFPAQRRAHLPLASSAPAGPAGRPAASALSSSTRTPKRSLRCATSRAPSSTRESSGAISTRATARAGSLGEARMAARCAPFPPYRPRSAPCCYPLPRPSCAGAGCSTVTATTVDDKGTGRRLTPSPWSLALSYSPPTQRTGPRRVPARVRLWPGWLGSSACSARAASAGPGAGGAPVPGLCRRRRDRARRRGRACWRGRRERSVHSLTHSPPPPSWGRDRKTFTIALLTPLSLPFSP